MYLIRCNLIKKKHGQVKKSTKIQKIQNPEECMPNYMYKNTRKKYRKQGYKIYIIICIFVFYFIEFIHVISTFKIFYTKKKYNKKSRCIFVFFIVLLFRQRSG